MSTRPSMVFLYDLDLVYANQHSKEAEKRDIGINATEQSFIRVLRYVSLSFLNHFTRKQVNIQWGYRFYSSSAYKHTHKTGFQELTEQSLEDFEESLNVQYEQHSLANTFTPSNMSKAGVLGRTLQDVATDFNWKTPTDSLTPTRKRKNGKQMAEQNLHNLVFIFTEVPSDETLSLFCNMNNNQSLTSKSATDCIFSKDLLKRINELQLSLNFVDFTNQSKKNTMRKIAAEMRGAVLSATALVSPFTFSQIFQAARALETSHLSKDSCQSCHQLQLSSNFVIQATNNVMEVDVQCWSVTCSRSSLSLGSEICTVPMLKCVPVYQGALPIVKLLNFKALYLLTTKNRTTFPMEPDGFLHIGKWGEHVFVIIPLNAFTASMTFPSSESVTTILKRKLDDEEGRASLLNLNAEIRDHVERIVPASLSPQLQSTVDKRSRKDEPIHVVKSNYAEKKTNLFGSSHWELLKDCFQLVGTQKDDMEAAKDNVKCLSERIKSNDTSAIVPPTDTVKMKIGNSRIQNLRASQLLQRSQQVRARNDEMEREKLNKEKQAADEKKEKKLKEIESYLNEVRKTAAVDGLVRITGDDCVASNEDHILERLVELKKRIFHSITEEWQLVCLAQIVASTVLYAWSQPERPNLDHGHETLSKHFLRTPAVVNRTAGKDDKIHEYKFQVLLRLELCWVTPSLSPEEEVLQEAVSFLQMLSIHSSPKVMSTFFQDTLVASYENMLPDLLINLGEELNQPIPSSLCDLVSAQNARGTPSPALSSGLLSVPSVNSHQEDGSQRPVVRELRSRTQLNRQPSLTILQHKKQIAFPTKTDKLSNTIIPGAAVNQAKKEDTSEVGRVRRSLQFGFDTPTKDSKAKSPNKLATPKRCQSDLSFALEEFVTPSKSAGLILAPETPSRLRSGGKNLKSDGIFVVGESPEVKQDAVRRSPRRLQAALALRRRASFYSTLSNSDVCTAGSSRFQN